LLHKNQILTEREGVVVAAAAVDVVAVVVVTELEDRSKGL
jgi:hypothetical protein